MFCGKRDFVPCVPVLLAACAPAQHVHVFLEADVNPATLEPAVSYCMSGQGFRLSPGSVVSPDRVETSWLKADVATEIVLYPGGGWIDVIGFVGCSQRRAIAVETARCLESGTEGLTTALQSHGRFVWGLGG